MKQLVGRGKLEEAAGIIQRWVDRGALAAATFHVRRDSFTYQRAFGEVTRPDGIFLIASITKPVTAAAVMILVDRGELALSDPVNKFIPGFIEGDRKLITVRHLLTHTSGLPDQLPENVELRQPHAPLEDFVRRVIETPLLFKPGSRVEYQSMGFLLAAEIAERISRMSFPQYLEEELCQPLGMKRSALGLGRFRLSQTARCQVEHAPRLYGGGSDQTMSWDWNSPYWRNLASPWGGAHSTGPDLARFFGCFLRPGGRVLRKETAASMVTLQTPGLNEPWGLGFSLDSKGFGRGCSPKTFGHLGATGTIAWADPEADLTCVLLTTLPLEASGSALLKPVCDLVSESAL